jgi:hypothetical protein
MKVGHCLLLALTALLACSSLVQVADAAQSARPPHCPPVHPGDPKFNLVYVPGGLVSLLESTKFTGRSSVPSWCPQHIVYNFNQGTYVNGDTGASLDPQVYGACIAALTVTPVVNGVRKNAVGVTIAVKGPFGSTYSVDPNHTRELFFNTTTQIFNYTRDYNLKVAQWDSRYNTSDLVELSSYAADLTTLVSDMNEYTCKKTILVAHSSGYELAVKYLKHIGEAKANQLFQLFVGIAGDKIGQNMVPMASFGCGLFGTNDQCRKTFYSWGLFAENSYSRQAYPDFLEITFSDGPLTVSQFNAKISSLDSDAKRMVDELNLVSANKDNSAPLINTFYYYGTDLDTIAAFDVESIASNGMFTPVDPGDSYWGAQVQPGDSSQLALTDQDPPVHWIPQMATSNYRLTVDTEPGMNHDTSLGHPDQHALIQMLARPRTAPQTIVP